MLTTRFGRLTSHFVRLGAVVALVGTTAIAAGPAGAAVRSPQAPVPQEVHVEFATFPTPCIRDLVWMDGITGPAGRSVEFRWQRIYFDDPVNCPEPYQEFIVADGFLHLSLMHVRPDLSRGVLVAHGTAACVGPECPSSTLRVTLNVRVRVNTEHPELGPFVGRGAVRVNGRNIVSGPSDPGETNLYYGAG
jgi:hypothetical protein